MPLADARSSEARHQGETVLELLQLTLALADDPVWPTVQNLLQLEDRLGPNGDLRDAWRRGHVGPGRWAGVSKERDAPPPPRQAIPVSADGPG